VVPNPVQVVATKVFAEQLARLLVVLLIMIGVFFVAATFLVLKF
jgi:hypothetical protein